MRLVVVRVTRVTAQPSQREWNESSGATLHVFTARSENQVITSQDTLPTVEVCARIKRIGYAISQKIRIYGEEFDVLSDPFGNDGGIAIEVRSKRTSQTRVLQLPATIIHRVRRDIARIA